MPRELFSSSFRLTFARKEERLKAVPNSAPTQRYECLTERALQHRGACRSTIIFSEANSSEQEMEARREFPVSSSVPTEQGIAAVIDTPTPRPLRKYTPFDTRGNFLCYRLSAFAYLGKQEHHAPLMRCI